jgi:hypothetical protein
MSAERALPAEADEQAKAAPHPLKVVEAASLSSTSDATSGGMTKTQVKGSSLGSLKLAWLDQVTADTGASDAAFRVGHIIAQHINDRERKAWPKLSTIALRLGRVERSIRDAVHELVRRSHLESSKRGSGNLNQYALLINGLSIEDRDRAQAEAVAISKSAATKRRSASSATSADRVSAKAFESFMEAFPPREVKHDLARARAAYETNLMNGTSSEVMLAGAQAYHSFCYAQKNTGTDQVCGAHYWLEIGGWRASDPDDLIPDDGEFL